MSAMLMESADPIAMVAAACRMVEHLPAWHEQRKADLERLADYLLIEFGWPDVEPVSEKPSNVKHPVMVGPRSPEIDPERLRNVPLIPCASERHLYLAEED